VQGLGLLGPEVGLVELPEGAKPVAAPALRRVERTIGTIERVMIDKVTGIVAYAVLSPHGSVEVPQKQLSIPWPRLTYDRKLGAYRLDLINGGLGDAPSDASDKDYDRAGRERYWGIAETW